MQVGSFRGSLLGVKPQINLMSHCLIIIFSAFFTL